MVRFSILITLFACSSACSTGSRKETGGKPSSESSAKNRTQTVGTSEQELTPRTKAPKRLHIATQKTHQFVATHVIRNATSYYLQGPQQATPPDGTLTVGTEIRLVKRQGSYVIIETNTGLSAHVSAAAIAPRQ
jgi:hypothetical protein